MRRIDRLHLLSRRAAILDAIIYHAMMNTDG